MPSSSSNGLTLAARAPEILARLTPSNLAFAKRYAGESAERQPVHVVYGGAQFFSADIAQQMGAQALAALDEYARTPFAFARAMGLPGHETLPLGKKKAKALVAAVRESPAEHRAEHPAAWLAVTVHDRVREKLAREPVEDYRVDFEDGFGVRPDAEEDAAAVRVAEEMARGLQEGAALPPFLGIRIKTFNEELKARAVRTLDLVLTTLSARGAMPPWFAVTLPKVTSPEQVAALSELLGIAESTLGLEGGSLKIELMVELTQSVFDPQGRLQLLALAEAGGGRVVGAHFGTYDYTACNGITAAHQAMSHPVCRHALSLMKIAYANTGVFLSDGATGVLPVPVHRGEVLTGTQRRENLAAVHHAWALSREHIHGSLVNGFFQGWDMHAAQLPVRYATTFSFFLAGFDAAATRLSTFLDNATKKTLFGDVFDDAATGQALLNYFLRALNSGAVSAEDLAVTGLTPDEIAGRSFTAILARRTAAPSSAPSDDSAPADTASVP